MPVFACDAPAASTVGTRGGVEEGGRAGQGGTAIASAGGSTTSAAGTGGTSPGGAGGTSAVGAGGSGTGTDGGKPFFAKRPGRPRSLSYVDGRLLWILGTSADDANGSLEIVELAASSEPRVLFPSSPPIACFAVRPGEAAVWAGRAAPVGGIVKRSVATAEATVMWDDGASASALAVTPGNVYRSRDGGRSASFIERLDLAAKRADRVGASDEDDAYVGTLLADAQSIFFSQEGFGSASGIFRVGAGEIAATYLGGDSAERFVLTQDALLRFEAHGSSLPASREITTSPKSGGASTLLGSFTATAIANGATLGAWYYAPLRQSDTGPWALWRLPLGGGEPTLVSPILCQADALLPSLAASDTTLFAACPGDGTVRAVDMP